MTAEIITTLQVLNRASWQETFLALWLSALRLVQRVVSNLITFHCWTKVIMLVTFAYASCFTAGT